MNAPVSIPVQIRTIPRNDLFLYTRLQRDSLDYDVIIWFEIATFSPGRPECRYQRNGDPGWPAEPAEYEFRILDIEFDGGDTTDPLTETERGALTAWFEANHCRACETADECAPDREADRADYEYECYRDEMIERSLR